MIDYKFFECSAKRLDNGELVFGAYVPEYTLDNPNEGGCIVDREYGIQYLVDPKTVELKNKPKTDFSNTNSVSTLLCKDKQYISKEGEIVKPLFVGEMNLISEDKAIYSFTECVVFEHLWGSHHILSSADFFAKYEPRSY
ncbi:hypothetical protein [Sulfurospirillum multivorans]|uniref:Uncharacterized protein n=2 Tax=Sulfurospirillum multivorans TaxID=66821 RepID=A0AA86APB5_SULMK|nr:hypothetical protein [Sulfurospirillum multivorans]AHJ13106.1 hypothetical protein SMUL_1851 [Sulfurospirillum multivorans DSM 12446]QEH06594.1 hypothetical protein SMN_1829 [Sulfurospirillum multivorans]